MKAKGCSTSPPGGYQVDDLPPVVRSEKSIFSMETSISQRISSILKKSFSRLNHFLLFIYVVRKHSPPEWALVGPFGQNPEVVRSTLLRQGPSGGPSGENRGHLHLARRAIELVSACLESNTIGCSGCSGRLCGAKLFLRFGRFFDHSSGSPNSNAMRRSEFRDN